MANQLSPEKRAQILSMLVEGNSLRSTSRMADVSINTVTKLLVDAGTACAQYHHEHVTNLNTKRVECDEIWSYVYAKELNVKEGMDETAGDAWTWVGIDADSKLIISWLVGDRTIPNATEFMKDLKSRLSNRVQLTTDGFRAYLQAVEHAFPDGDVDFAQLVKLYETNAARVFMKNGQITQQEYLMRRYSPTKFVSTERKIIHGQPDKKLISTSYVERQNLTMRMHMRRFTRLTNAFSKKLENHCHAIALHFVYYNFCKIHKTLRVTPAMEAGLTKEPWTVSRIVELIANNQKAKA